MQILLYALCYYFNIHKSSNICNNNANHCYPQWKGKPLSNIQQKLFSLNQVSRKSSLKGLSFRSFKLLKKKQIEMEIIGLPLCKWDRTGKHRACKNNRECNLINQNIYDIFFLMNDMGLYHMNKIECKFCSYSGKISGYHCDIHIAWHVLVPSYFLTCVTS